MKTELNELFEERELENFARSAFEEAMSFGISLDSFTRLANTVHGKALVAISENGIDGAFWRSMKVDGADVLVLKWQNEDQEPSILFMVPVDGLYAEAHLGYDNEAKRDEKFADRDLIMEAAIEYVRLARAAVGGDKA